MATSESSQSGERPAPSSEQRAESAAGRGEAGTSQQQSPRRREGFAGTFGWPTPFSLMRRLFDDMERLADEYIPGRFGPEGSGRDLQRLARGFWMPQIDVFERDGKLVVRADLPGLSKQDVRAEIEGNELVLEGERRREVEEERGGRYRSERSYGSFRRAIPLPDGADARRGALRQRRARGRDPAAEGPDAHEKHRDPGGQAIAQRPLALQAYGATGSAKERPCRPL